MATRVGTRAGLDLLLRFDNDALGDTLRGDGVIEKALKDRILREIALVGGLILAGLVLLPLAIYFVGQGVFGAYGGDGFAGFYKGLHNDFRAADPAAVFLLLSPCIVWQLLRLTLWLFRRSGRRAAETP